MVALPFVLAVSLGVGVGASCDTIAPLARICTRDGAFVEKKSGKEFRPVGFHYIRILPDGVHYVFAPSQYDPARVEAMFSDLEKNGFNIVRVFMGNLELTEGDGLSGTFLDNVVDFLERATRHRIYVLLVVDWIPGSQRYTSIVANARPDVDGMQRLLLDKANITAKSLYLKDFISMLKERRPALLSSIFAYELENEVCIDLDKLPFSQTSGTFACAGKQYDLANEQDLQKLVDTAIVDNANKLTTAIRSVDPQAMVAYSVFSYAAVGRSGPNRIRSDVSHDMRCPIRPLALAKSKLSYVDLHFYAPNPEGLESDLKSLEWDKLTSACRAEGKPILAGEYGVPSSLAADGEQSARCATWHLQNLLEKGMTGGIFWTYDCHEQENVVNAKQFDGAIFDALTKLNTTVQSTVPPIEKSAR